MFIVSYAGQKIGPFPDANSAAAWANNHISNPGTWHIVKLVDPQHAEYALVEVKERLAKLGDRAASLPITA